MKKIISLLLILTVCLLALAGCGHTHTWVEADCATPKTCSECGETEGEALGHTWVDATCTTPKTCSVCGATEGEALGHSWIDATCTTPKMCSVCGATEGEALGHSWVDATCTEPKTCSVCGETDGDPLGHDTPDLTCTTDAHCTRCGELINAPGHTLTEATCTEPAKCTVCGEVVGDPLGHTTTNGVCERCSLEIYETVSGQGDDVRTDISVGDSIYRVHFTHSGSRNFIVKSYDVSNSKDLLVNEIGSYDGYVLLLGSAPFSFEITADGSWSYTIEPIPLTSDTSFSGSGDCVTGLSLIPSGAWEFSHDGNSNFIVKLYTSDGRTLAVNDIGAYSGKKMLTIPTDSLAFFEIQADGNWTINPS